MTLELEARSRFWIPYQNFNVISFCATTALFANHASASFKKGKIQSIKKKVCINLSRESGSLRGARNNSIGTAADAGSRQGNPWEIAACDFRWSMARPAAATAAAADFDRFFFPFPKGNQLLVRVHYASRRCIPPGRRSAATTTATIRREKRDRQWSTPFFILFSLRSRFFLPRERERKGMREWGSEREKERL